MAAQEGAGGFMKWGVYPSHHCQVIDQKRVVTLPYKGSCWTPWSHVDTIGVRFHFLANNSTIGHKLK